jgi:long-chain fatty acid transport protein
VTFGRAGVAAGIAAALLSPAVASASPLFELAGAAQGQGGFSARAVEGGSGSTYFNPAFLPSAESGFDLGVFVLDDSIAIRLHGRPTPSADVPVDSIHAEQPGGGRFARYGIPTIWLENGKAATPPDPALAARPRQSQGSGNNLRVYQVIGFVQKLFHGRLGVGVYAMVPYSKFTGAAAFYVDEREQYFSNSLHPELYADRLTATSLAFGAGFKVLPELSLGVAATLGLHTEAVTPTYLTDVGRFQDISVDSNVTVNTSLAPHFGMVYEPSESWRLTATLHTVQKFEIGTNFTFLVSNGLEQGASVSFTHAYLPWQVGLGAAHDLMSTGADKITVTATALYAHWSDYVDRHSEHPSGPYAWYDTLSPIVGARFVRGPTRVLLDLAYQRSPVPGQTGRTNYVDEDRLGTTAAVDHVVSVPGGRLRVGLTAQVHRLLPRDTWKLPTPTSSDGVNRAPELVADEVPDNAVVGGRPLAGREGLQTNNPGWPGFASSGWIVGGGVNVSFTY